MSNGENEHSLFDNTEKKQETEEQTPFGFLEPLYAKFEEIAKSILAKIKEIIKLNSQRFQEEDPEGQDYYRVQQEQEKGGNK